MDPNWININPTCKWFVIENHVEGCQWKLFETREGIFKKSWTNYLSITVYHKLTSTIQNNEPYNIRGECYQWSQSINQKFEASWEKSENMFPIDKLFNPFFI